MQHTQNSRMRSRSQYLKKMHEATLQGVVNDLVKEKDDGWKSRTSRDSYTTKLECLEIMGISITRDALYKRVERQSQKQANTPTRPVEELSLNQNDTEVSSLSSPSTGSATIEITGDNDVSESTSKVGRPKGSTMQKKQEDIINYKECVNAIAEAYDNELTAYRSQNKRLVKGYLGQLILQKKEEFGVSCNISVQTVRSRIK